MFFLIEEWLFYLLVAGCSLGAFLLVADLVVLKIASIGHLLVKLISAWLKKKVIDMEASDDGVLDFVLRNMTAEGLISEVKINGVKYTDAKLVPQASNPITNKRFFLKNTGIPVFMSWVGAPIAATPELLASMEVVAGDKKDLDPAIKKWAEKENISVEEIEKLQRPKIEEETTAKKIIKKSLLALDPRKLVTFLIESGIYPKGQLRIIIKKAEIRGEERAGNQYLKMAIPIGLLVLLGVVVFVILAFFGGMQ